MAPILPNPFLWIAKEIGFPTERFFRFRDRCSIKRQKPQSFPRRTSMSDRTMSWRDAGRSRNGRFRPYGVCCEISAALLSCRRDEAQDPAPDFLGRLAWASLEFRA